MWPKGNFCKHGRDSYSCAHAQKRAKVKGSEFNNYLEPHDINYQITVYPVYFYCSS